MQCWSCNKELEEIPLKVPFRATCDHCASWLHVCKNCSNYRVGAANECTIPDVERVTDKEKYNYCDEFQLLKERNIEISDINAAARKLFGDTDKHSEHEKRQEGGTNPFDKLFND